VISNGKSYCKNNTFTYVRFTSLIAKNVSEEYKLFYAVRNKYFISYFFYKFLSNWLLFLIVMQENNSWCFFLNTVYFSRSQFAFEAYTNQIDLDLCASVNNSVCQSVHHTGALVLCRNGLTYHQTVFNGMLITVSKIWNWVKEQLILRYNKHIPGVNHLVVFLLVFFYINKFMFIEHSAETTQYKFRPTVDGCLTRAQFFDLCGAYVNTVILWSFAFRLQAMNRL